MIRFFKYGKFYGGRIKLPVLALLLSLFTLSAVYGAEKTLPIDELKGKTPAAESTATATPAATASPADKTGTAAVEKQETASPAPAVSSTPAGSATAAPAPVKSDSPAPKASESPAKGSKSKDKSEDQIDLFSILKDETPVNGDVSPPTKSPVNIPLTLLSMLAVCLLAYVLLRVFGKHLGNITMPGSRKRMINIIDKQVIAPNKQVCVVEVPGKTILIGMTDNDINMLCELDQKAVAEFKEPEEVKEAAPSSAVSYLTDVFMKKWPGGK
ncbi:MAG: flagellar biosynthetic protein FliO [Firmicutes bacterium]|nr:flagellar biosynthetic protein FliO [Bacillota bacterium]